ncbi:hypothetical protein [Sediminicola luteus]|nr:hypothetical protein [Sediminicola luteus]
MEYPDPQMRNLEYVLYIILSVYVFKAFDTLFTVLSYNDYDHHLIPETFLPIGITIFILYLVLMYVTFSLFLFRKEHIGAYDFESLNEKIDPWP